MIFPICKKKKPHEHKCQRKDENITRIIPFEETKNHLHKASRGSGRHALARSLHKMQSYTVLPFTHGLMSVGHPCSLKKNLALDCIRRDG
jgi:hypothetical protein